MSEIIDIHAHVLIVSNCSSEIPVVPMTKIFFVSAAMEYFWDNQKMQLVCVLALLTVSVFLKADYGWRGFVFLLIMYWFRNDKTAQAIIGSCWLYYEWKACFAFLSINMYNGERGFVKDNPSARQKASKLV